MHLKLRHRRKRRSGLSAELGEIAAQGRQVRSPSRESNEQAKTTSEARLLPDPPLSSLFLFLHHTPRSDINTCTATREGGANLTLSPCDRFQVLLDQVEDG
jgi:hypothetical protein